MILWFYSFVEPPPITHLIVDLYVIGVVFVTVCVVVSPVVGSVTVSVVSLTPPSWL